MVRIVSIMHNHNMTFVTWRLQFVSISASKAELDRRFILSSSLILTAAKSVYGKPNVFTKNTAICARVTGFSGQ